MAVRGERIDILTYKRIWSAYLNIINGILKPRWKEDSEIQFIILKSKKKQKVVIPNGEFKKCHTLHYFIFDNIL